MDLMQRRRALMMGQKKARLPKGYQEVEYLRANLGPYIDTGFYLDSNCTVYGKIKRLVVSQTDALFGARQSVTLIAFNIFNLNGVARFDYGLMRESWSVSYDDNIIEFSFGNNSTVNGKDHAYSGDAFSVPCSAFIFGINQSGGPDARFAQADAYYIKITRTGLTEREFIPCYRESDNKPGMYDLCGSICPLTNSPFYVNAGTGEFLVGPEVN